MKYNIIRTNDKPVNRYKKPIFMGALPGIYANSIYKPSDVNRDYYLERIKGKAWRPKRLNYKKGVDNDYQAIPEQSNHNRFFSEKKARDALHSRYKIHRPYEKEVGYISNSNYNYDSNERLGIRQEEVPRYGGTTSVTVPALRNTSKFWKKVKRSPEDILRVTFRSGKNRSRSFKGDKYLNKSMVGFGRGQPWFRDSYQRPQTYRIKYKDSVPNGPRNPFTHIPGSKSYMNKEPIFNNIGKKYMRTTLEDKNKRGSLLYNAPRYEGQNIFNTTGVKNTGNHKQLMINKNKSYISGKLESCPNSNIIKRVLPYDKGLKSSKLIKGGPVTLDRFSMPAVDVLNNYKNNIETSRGTKNNIKRLPIALQKKYTNNAMIKSRYAIRDTTKNGVPFK